MPKMNRKQLAEVLAESLNILDFACSEVESENPDSESSRKICSLWLHLKCKLPELVQENLRYNGTVMPDEL